MAVLEVATPEAFEREVLRAPEPTVVMFWAGWCPFCQAFKPLFDARTAKNEGRFAVVRLDDADSPLWERYDVAVVPSLAFFRDGTLVARRDGRLMRGLTDAELDAFLRQVLPASRPA
jgi:thioredoxin 1